MDKEKILDYIMETPGNTNWNVLSTMVEEGDWTELKAYVEQTSYNMNRQVLNNFFSAGESDDDGIVLLNGTYEFTKHSKADYALYLTNLERSYSPESVTVTIDGKTVVLPKTISQSGTIGYGEYDANSLPSFVTYPVAVLINSSRLQLVVTVPTAGEHTVKVTAPNEGESAEVLFESELNFVLNPAGASAFLGSSDVKNNIFDKLSDNDNIRITINNHSITGTISSKESSDGYSTTKYSNLIDTSYCDRVQVTWDHYGQSKSASLEINIQDTAGTYNVKIEKL